MFLLSVGSLKIIIILILQTDHRKKDITSSPSDKPRKDEMQNDRQKITSTIVGKMTGDLTFGKGKVKSIGKNKRQQLIPNTAGEMKTRNCKVVSQRICLQTQKLNRCIAIFLQKILRIVLPFVSRFSTTTIILYVVNVYTVSRTHVDKTSYT